MNQQRRAALASKYQSDGMAGASQEKLLLAVFDRLRRDLDASVTAIQAGRIETAHERLVNAQELVYELQLALDADLWPGASDLRSIYDHLMTLLIDANLTKSVTTIERCSAIVIPIGESWAEAYERIQRGDSAAGTGPSVPVVGP